MIALNYHQAALVRFFARRRRLGSNTEGNIDVHRSLGNQDPMVERAASANVRRGATYFVRGWAIDLTRRRIPWDVLVEVDGRVVPAQTRLQIARPDVASTFGGDVVLSGFTATFDTRSLAIGPHDLSVRAIVGRRGAAYAKIPSLARFFVLSTYPPALPRRADLPHLFTSYHVAPIPLVSAGSVFELEGWALDDDKSPVIGVAAQVDDNPWHEGWTGVKRDASSGFCVRIRLDGVKPGTHKLRLAAKTRDGRWGSLGPYLELLVTTGASVPNRWSQELIDGGEASITDEEGRPLTRIVLYRLSRSMVIRGTLRRSTPLGASVTLIARAVDDDVEVALPAWGAPTNDPLQLLFGGELSADALPPNTYRLFIEAPDASERFVGRSDIGCVLVMRPNADRAASELEENARTIAQSLET
jgi:hypothetical protein